MSGRRNDVRATGSEPLQLLRPARVLLLTIAAMAAFSGNSLLCRLALDQTDIDAASFTTIRLASGALMLWIVVRARQGAVGAHGDWISAGALFVYAAGFSFAYEWLTAGVGALLLFGAVQATMIGYALYSGERVRAAQSAGLAIAFSGLVWLLLPGLSAPPLGGAALMLASGVAWGVYSLRGRGVGDPTRATFGNFVRATPLAVIVSLFLLNRASLDPTGVAYALASGALTSGLGYVLWYAVVRDLKAASAATVQLSVPALTALGGVVILGETLTLRLVIASAAILGGAALAIRR